MAQPFRFDATIGGVAHIATTAEELQRLGIAAAEIAAAVSAATARAVEAEMRRRVAVVWGAKRASAQSYWTALVAKGSAATAEEAADRDALASGDAWEAGMLDAAKALAAKGDIHVTYLDASWPPAPAALVALIAEPFAL